MLRNLVLYILVFSLPLTNVWAESGTVGSSTASTATANASQRKTFYDSANERHWAFYYNGSAIEYALSADGVAWTVVGTLPYNTVNFSVSHKVIQNTAYVFLAVEANSFDIELRRGTLSASAVNFEAAQTVLDGTAASDSYQNPTLALDSNNKLWVGGIREYGNSFADHLQVTAARSTNAASGDLSAFDAPMLVGRRVAYMENVVLLPRGGAEMYALINSDHPNIVGYRFDGTAWSLANEGGDLSWFSFTGGLGSGAVFTAFVSGSDLYIGGNFVNAGGIAGADYIARWDGSHWHALGSGLNGHVWAIHQVGTDIYAGGQFLDIGGDPNADRIARFDGTSWNALGSGIGTGQVNAIRNIGTDIYVGGSFTDAGGNLSADRIARWDGATWQALGVGLSAEVFTIEVLGTDVYAGGDFANPGADANDSFIARWDGAAWRALGGAGVTNTVRDIEIVGTDIYLVGNFLNAGGVANADSVARFDGANWFALGVGGDIGATPRTITVVGSDVYVGGSFTNAAGNPAADRVARWDGAAWHDLTTSGMSTTVEVLAAQGSDIFIGGTFSWNNGDPNLDKLMRWDGTTLNPVGTAALNGSVNVITLSGTDVYLGGTFQNLFGIPDVDYIARWDGSRWNSFGGGLIDRWVYAIAISGNDVYVGGNFNAIAGVPFTAGLARWDGNNWNSLGTGLSRLFGGETVNDILIDNTDVYVAGDFHGAGGLIFAGAYYIARWDGATWHALGNGASGIVHDIEMLNGNLYVGGEFLDLATIGAADKIAMWDGAAWNAVGPGLNGDVRALQVYNNEIYAGGLFTDAGGDLDADFIARWDGAAWDALGVVPLSALVNSMEVLGNSLIVGGGFVDAGGVAEADGIASWNGTNWNNIGAGLNDGNLLEITASDSALYVGGTFTGLGSGNAIVGPSRFGIYGPAGAIDADTTSEVSSVSDSAGNLHLLYVNNQDDLLYRRYDAGTEEWQTVVTLRTGTISSPALALDPGSDDLHAFWVEGGNVLQKRGVSGYTSSDWASAATVISNSGVTTGLTVHAVGDYSDLVLTRTEGASAPYSVISEHILFQRRIAGTFIKNGVAMSGVEVVLSSGAERFKTTTDGSGNFSLFGFPTGNYTLTFEKDGLILRRQAVVVLSNSSGSSFAATTSSLSNPVYGFWNGYLGMQNVLEVVNESATPLTILVEVFGYDGQSLSVTQIAQITVSAQQQQDIVLNELGNFGPDAYGLVRLSANHDDFDARVSYYKASSAESGAYDFAYSLPLESSVQGASFVNFNTSLPLFAPEDTGTIALNWLSIGNPASVSKMFTVHFYDESGSTITSGIVTVPGTGRIDIDGGHGVAGSNRVGLVEIVPADAGSAYVATLNRFGRNPDGSYASAAGYAATQAPAGAQYLPISNSSSAVSFVEVVNTGSSSVSTVLELHAADGSLVHSETFALGAKQQVHLPLASYLAINAAGYASLTPNSANSIQARVVTYHYSTLSRALLSIEHSPSQQGSGSFSFGTYNMFFGMENWLRVMNTTASDLWLVLTVGPAASPHSQVPILIPANGRFDYGLHDLASFNTAIDSYDSFNLTGASGGEFVAELLRVKRAADSTIDFSMTAPVR